MLTNSPARTSPPFQPGEGGGALLRWLAMAGLWVVFLALVIPATVLHLTAALLLRALDVLADLIAEVRG